MKIPLKIELCFINLCLLELSIVSGLTKEKGARV